MLFSGFFEPRSPTWWTFFFFWLDKIEKKHQKKQWATPTQNTKPEQQNTQHRTAMRVTYIHCHWFELCVPFRFRHSAQIKDLKIDHYSQSIVVLIVVPHTGNRRAFCTNILCLSLESKKRCNLSRIKTVFVRIDPSWNIKMVQFKGWIF